MHITTKEEIVITNVSVKMLTINISNSLRVLIHLSIIAISLPVHSFSSSLLSNLKNFLIRLLCMILMVS